MFSEWSADSLTVHRTGPPGLASKFNLVRTAIFTFMIPDKQMTTIRIFIPIPSECFINFKL